ncbi:hypothetical protein EX30DRAFT_263581 [Ascodesmis nigricans]|uniref:Uncharacterized protein n=1 Tax=Ascodesmis nigricans TaxID=341454 RepID=A0A4S2MXX6_9PEZI|nr:hypothetical protein EX30DRAFT_263581 [Ascodesmis nigricans]
MSTTASNSHRRMASEDRRGTSSSPPTVTPSNRTDQSLPHGNESPRDLSTLSPTPPTRSPHPQHSHSSPPRSPHNKPSSLPHHSQTRRS